MAVKGGGQGGRAGKSGSHRKGSTAGSGGQGRRKLSGKKPTPPARERTGHPAKRRADAAERREKVRTRRADAEFVVGRNPVVEALRARVPATGLYVALGIEIDERIREIYKLADSQAVTLHDLPRSRLDQLVGRASVHQGVALAVSPFRYADLADVLARAAEAPTPALIVALDGVTDPRNLGAVIRSAAAFGAHGIVLPERRSAGVTASAWKTSAGAAARLPVARVSNLVRALEAIKKEGIFLIGLDGDGETDLDELELASGPVAVVVGGEGAGLGRLVAESCDLVVRIPMSGMVESLNASVAASITLAEIARRRRTGS